jgi:hypothetical protein
MKGGGGWGKELGMMVNFFSLCLGFEPAPMLVTPGFVLRIFLFVAKNGDHP